MYRIIDGGTFFDLDATLQGDVTLSGKITDKPLSDGNTAADHYVNSPNAISFSGVVTDVKSFYNDSAVRVQDWIKLLSDLKSSGRSFTVQAADGSGMFFTDCLFETITFSNDPIHGVVDGENGVGMIYSYNVSFSIKQIKRARRGRLVSEPAIDFTQRAPTTGSGTTDTPNEDKPSSKTTLDTARELSKQASILNNK
jgi:hypothetical protein